MTGLAINMIIGQPPLLLPAMLGGILWTTGIYRVATDSSDGHLYLGFWDVLTWM